MSDVSRRRLLLAAALAALSVHGRAASASGASQSVLVLGRLRLAQGPLDPQFDLSGINDVGAWIRADFAAGRTLTLDGWVVSRTEAELCARLTMEQEEIGAA